jgi:hypothetical protein
MHLRHTFGISSNPFTSWRVAAFGGRSRRRTRPYSKTTRSARTGSYAATRPSTTPRSTTPGSWQASPSYVSLQIGAPTETTGIDGTDLDYPVRFVDRDHTTSETHFTSNSRSADRGSARTRWRDG